METIIDSFSCDLFWFKVTPSFITFGSRELPDKVHVTVAFNGNSNTEINLHISKNTSAKDKPKITIAAIKKNELVDLFPLIGKALINRLLKKVDDAEFKRLFDHLHIMNNTGKKGNPEIEKQLIRSFKTVSRLTKNKTKLEIKGSLENSLDSFQKSHPLKKYVPDSIEFGVQKKIKSGLVAFQGTENYFIKIGGSWYKLNNVTFNDLLISVLGRGLANDLVAHFDSSLDAIQSCHSYSDSRKFDIPILLYKTQKA